MKTRNYSSLRQEIATTTKCISYKNSLSIHTTTIVEMIKSKNEKGFHILYDKYSTSLYGILMKMVRNSEIADDLLQDTFIKIWKHIEDFNPTKGTIFTWMLNISRNLAIDYLRSSAYRQQLLHVDMDLFISHAEHISTATSNARELESMDFKSSLLNLEPKYAEVIDMIFFYGWTHEQTALILKLPLGTVKTRVRKGFKMLKLLYR